MHKPLIEDAHFEIIQMVQAEPLNFSGISPNDPYFSSTLQFEIEININSGSQIYIIMQVHLTGPYYFNET